jgi:hypothetical protein
MELKGIRRNQNNLEKSKSGELIFTDFKVDCKATIIKEV